MKIEDITEEQMAAFGPRQRQWYVAWQAGKQWAEKALTEFLEQPNETNDA